MPRPEWLKLAGPDSFDKDQLVAVAIGVTGRDQLHMAVVHLEGKSVVALHFGLPGVQRDAPEKCFNQPHMWLYPTLLPPQRAVLTSICKAVWKLAPDKQIPYSFRYRGGVLSVKGIYEPAEGESGLTCASFVLALFRGVGVLLVDVDTWPLELEDTKYQLEFRKIVDPYLTPEQRARLRNDTPSPRFKPEEVTLAAHLEAEQRPAKHEALAPQAKAFVNDFWEAFNSAA